MLRTRKDYYLVTGTCAAEVERKTGLPSMDTPLGTLVEKKDPVIEAMQIGFALSQIQEAFNPRFRGCPECHGAVLHRPDCKIGNAIT